MPPKVKVTKEDIVNAAVQLVRENGEAAINARNIASYLQCSTQPVFSNFSTMYELRLAALKKADELCREYMQREVDKGEFPAYKANGMAYIRFAKEEKELFKLLYMRDRTDELIPETTEQTEEMEQLVSDNTGIDRMDAKLFHLEMWACVHGIATMFATGYFNLDWPIISKILTDFYQGLQKQYGRELKWKP